MVILFDGVCIFCSAAVQFIIRNDPARYFHFAALQSEKGKALLSKLNIQVDPLAPAEMVLIAQDRAWLGSEAVLQIVRKMRMPYPLLYPVLRLMPPFLRKGLYNLIARNRHKLKQEISCQLPDEQTASRFL